MSSKKYFNCPHCGAEVPQKALACRECGSDTSTGWSDSNEGLLDEDHDYAENRRREFGSDKPPFPSWIAITGFVLLFLLLIILFI